MNKYEFKYMYEQKVTKVQKLIDINGKNVSHVHDLYVKNKDEI